MLLWHCCWCGRGLSRKRFLQHVFSARSGVILLGFLGDIWHFVANMSAVWSGYRVSESMTSRSVWVTTHEFRCGTISDVLYVWQHELGIPGDRRWEIPDDQRRGREAVPVVRLEDRGTDAGRADNAANPRHHSHERQFLSTGALSSFIYLFITGPPNGPVSFCSLASVVCRQSASSVVVCNAAGGRAGRSPGAWAVGCTAVQYGYVPLKRHLV